MKIIQNHIKITQSDFVLLCYNKIVITALSIKQKNQKEEMTMKKETTLDATGHRKFSIRDCIAYAAGDLGCNMSFALKGTKIGRAHV